MPPVVQETPGLCNCHQTRNNPANNNYVSVLVFLLFGFCEPKWVLHCLFQIKVFFIAYLNKKPKRQGSVPIFSRLFLLDLDRTSRVCVGKITGLWVKFNISEQLLVPLIWNCSVSTCADLVTMINASRSSTSYYYYEGPMPSF